MDDEVVHYTLAVKSPDHEVLLLAPLLSFLSSSMHINCLYKSWDEVEAPASGGCYMLGQNLQLPFQFS